MSMFGTVAENNYDGLSIPVLDPGKYNVRLKEIIVEQLKKQDGTVGKWAMKFMFETSESGNNGYSNYEAGALHQHTEYQLDPSVDLDKFGDKWKNQTKRVGHILSKFVPKEQLTQNAQTWVEYANWVKNTLATVQYPSVPLTMIVTGSVYQGKAKSEFTGYPPFLAKREEAGKLIFDNNAKANNDKFYALRNAQNSPVPDNGAGMPQGSFSTAQGPKADF